ncbi:MAG: NPCBM/NEW2 domain-containing protein [Phycisphaerales bacterium]|nr:NPCBM/NEW2 domain-containing protein [Phycisphaerales bacterium]
MLMNRIVFVLALSLACPLHADWTLLKSDLTEQKSVTVNTWDLSAGLSITEAGKLEKVETRNVLSLMSERPAGSDSAAAGWKLMLRNGDCLYGKPSRFSGQSMEFEMPEVGKILVPLKSVAGMTDASAAATVGAVGSAEEKDQIQLKNNDVLAGFIISIDAEKLQIATGPNDETTTDIDLSRIARLSFGGVTPARGMPTLSARIHFISGSVLTIPLNLNKDINTTKNIFSWTISDLAFKDPAGKDRKASADTVAAIDIVGGRVVYLTDLDPAKEEQTTLMGTRWNTQINRNVMGEPLVVGRKTYLRGIGVHTTSSLLYTLDGSFETLKFQVGMDDSAAPQGSANVAVVLDGKVLWEARGMKAGEAAVEVSVPVKGGKQLELRATPALGNGKLDVLGRVNWLNVALLRP